jgi:hypothetical protein
MLVTLTELVKREKVWIKQLAFRVNGQFPVSPGCLFSFVFFVHFVDRCNVAGSTLSRKGVVQAVCMVARLAISSIRRVVASAPRALPGAPKKKGRGICSTALFLSSRH